MGGLLGRGGGKGMLAPSKIIGGPAPLPPGSPSPYAYEPIPFPMYRDGHNFHALFQYMFYTWVQNCTLIESFFNKILNVKHG